MSFDVFYSAWDTSSSDHKIGDAANHTVSVNVDGSGVTGLTETEVGNGRYKVTLSDAQLPPGSRFVVHGSSSTSAVKLFGESGVRPAVKTTHTETILHCKIGATTNHKIDLGEFGTTVSGTVSAQLYIDNTATGTAYNLTGPTGTEYPLPITIADDATLKGKAVRVTVTATVDDLERKWHVSSTAAVTATENTLGTAIVSALQDQNLTFADLVAFTGSVANDADAIPKFYQGDDYDSDTGGTITFTFSKGNFNTTGATSLFEASPTRGESFSATGTLTDNGDGTATIAMSLTEAQSNLLETGPITWSALAITSGGKRRTISSGQSALVRRRH